ncbi:MAG: MATE family efflux transporter [Clostridia bacterium]|nr:MATE family efflux transporter [Clostridia bacterium]
MLSIAVPVVINSLLQTVYNLTDTYWLGQIGKEPLAAINLVTPVQNIVLNVGGGVTVAGAVMIAQYIGAGRHDEAKKTANQIFSCAMILAICSALLLALFTPAIVAWLGAQDGTLYHAVRYLRIVILDMPFLFIINIYQATRQAQGDTVRPMLLNLLGISLNMAFDPLLMVALPLGAAGAALATVMAKFIPACIALRLMRDQHEVICLDFSLMRPERDRLRDIVRIGLPSALGGCVMQLGFLLMSRNVFVYGVDAMAAYGIGNRVNGIISLPSTGIGSAVSTIVGQNMGAGQVKRAEKGYLISMGCSIAFLFTGGMILSRPFIAQAIVSIFSADPSVVAMAADFLSTMAFWCWTNGIHDATSGLLKGTGHTEITMADNMARLWIYRFATLYICEHIFGLGVRSIWLSVVVSNGISSAVLLVLYLSKVWKKPRFHISR